MSFLAALVSRRDATGRIIPRDAAILDPEYREVLDAIHRPSR
jgi:signal recognition particle subunit SEC65